MTLDLYCLRVKKKRCQYSKTVELISCYSSLEVLSLKFDSTILVTIRARKRNVIHIEHRYSHRIPLKKIVIQVALKVNKIPKSNKTIGNVFNNYNYNRKTLVLMSFFTQKLILSFRFGVM